MRSLSAGLAVGMREGGEMAGRVAKGDKSGGQVQNGRAKRKSPDHGDPGSVVLWNSVPQRLTVREMVVVLVVLPLVPVMVMVRVPVVPRLLTVIFIVEVPAPVMEEGLKEMVVPLAWPEAERAMAESKPPVTEEVMVTLPELLRTTVMEVGEALSEKLAVVPVTVSETVVVSTVLPEVPLTVME